MRFAVFSAHRQAVSCLAILCLAGCSAEMPEASLSTASIIQTPCTENSGGYEAGPLDISIAPAPLGAASEISDRLPPSVKFREGLHLTSTESEFGGLSGLEVFPTGDLLAVSDNGYFITFDPNGKKRATIMPLLDAAGRSLSGKTKGDAEGLALKDGIAFVSFERKHRILAYNLGRCGVAARGVLFAGSPENILKTKLKTNDGAEALDVTADGRIRAGYEMVINGGSPWVTFEDNGAPVAKVDTVPTKADFKLVGADDGYLLFRAYDPEKGNRNIIRGPGVEFELTPPLNVDNFEGIAVKRLEDGTTRLYLISDDNFSARQRTLLYVFDIND